MRAQVATPCGCHRYSFKVHLGKSLVTKPSMTVRLAGGLGNQMFQYAAARSLATTYRLPLYLDTTHFAKVLLKRGISPSEDAILGELAIRYLLPVEHLRRLLSPVRVNQSSEGLWACRIQLIQSEVKTALNIRNPILRERSLCFDSRVIARSANGAHLIGFWQSPKYFEDHSDLIKRIFSRPLFEATTEQESYAKYIRDSSGICLHVRRGDYASNAKTLKFHGLLGPDYYESAVRIVRKRVGHHKIFVFTDSPNWCATNLKIRGDVELVPSDVSHPSGLGHFWLMQFGSAIVTANSTFSWWSAWLSDVPDDHIVAPKQWFVATDLNCRDRFPSRWIVI